MQKHRETGHLVALLILLPGLFGLLAGQGCHSEKSARDEAHEVLERIARLDPNAPLDVRRAAIEAISALPVTHEDLQGLRTVCLAAHRGLLEAEVTQAGVRTALASDAPPSQDALAALQAKMQQAAATLATAQTALSTCEKLSRDATVRYR